MSQLCEFYDNLDYDKIDRKEILSKIRTLADTTEIEDVSETCQRFRKTALVIEKNISLFHAVFRHVDVATTIIECLNNYCAKLEHGIDYCTEDTIPMLIMYMLFNVCPTFCEDVEYFLKKMLEFPGIPQDCSTKAELELIILEDSDLHAVMFYLMGLYKTDVYYPLPTKILIHEPIKEKFLYYKEKYETHLYRDGALDVEIKVFRSKQELLTSRKSCFLNLVSIWSEDIATAKNLAISLNRDWVFINAYFELHTDVLLPRNIFQIDFEDTLNTRFKCDCDDDNTVTIQNVIDGPVNNLFYNGSWQKPVKERYWMQNKSLWAQAEWYDISKCVLSASEGFGTWRNTSVESRIQILSKFAHSLECTGKIPLANIIRKWINFLYIYESSVVHTKKETGERIEVTKIHKGNYVIIIKEETETALFDRLTQTLIAGNSVIVICDASCCNLAPYCDMLSASKMPPGVVNLLSHKNVHHLERYLCEIDYETYKIQFFSEDARKTFTELTVLKHILLHL